MTAQARLLGGRYQVGELLGYGGMAEVHRGRDLRLGRDVAIKLLRVDLARDKTFQERFRREAQNAAALNHPAIVAVYDTGEEIGATGEKLPYIVMEFVNGRTLKEVLGAEGRLMPRRALEIEADICAALDFSHRHGIIHRDIKPGNVMLNQSGQVKVMDFGIARALASGATTMTQTSAVIGTAQYLSPEQARGESVDARSDVYAAGCVLFELLVGHPPFVGDSPVSVAYQHVREDPRAPSELNREVPPDVDAVVLKALAKNPLNRYQSAGEMRADVLRAAAGRPVAATPVLREDAATMAMGAATAPMGAAATQVRPPTRAAEPPRKRGSAWALAALTALGVLAVIALVVGLYLNNRTTTVTVPPVIDQKIAVAEAAIRQANLTPVQGEPDKGSCTVGNVTAQDPAANTKAPKGSNVTLTVCAGPGTVQVPGNLVGKSYDFVESTLRGMNLKPQRNYVSSTAPKDQVVAVPDAGKQVPEGAPIRVDVSSGNLVKVPDVSTKSEDVARSLLETAGFSVKVVHIDTNDPAENGNVIDQDPSAGSLRDPSKTRVTIKVGQLQVEPTDTGEPTPTASATTGG